MGDKKTKNGKGENRMKKLLLISALIILLTSFVSADINDTTYIEIDIQNNVIKTNGIVETTISGIGRVNVTAGFISFNDTLGDNLIDCDEVNVNGTNYFTNCTLQISFKRVIPLRFNNVISVTTTESDTLQKLNQCLEERGNFLGSYTSCQSEKIKLDAADINLTNCKTELSACSTERNNLQTQKGSLETEREANKNKPITWGIIGLLLGAGGAYYFLNHSGVKLRRLEDNYNLQGAS